MEQELESMARSDVLHRYDEVRNIRLHANYQKETYKHVMLPVYSTAYTYKGKQYRVLVNGQSGKVQGDYPKSPFKIAAIVIAVMAVLGLLFWYSEGGRMTAAKALAAGEQQTVVEMTEEKEVRTEEEPLWDYLEDSLPT